MLLQYYAALRELEQENGFLPGANVLSGEALLEHRSMFHQAEGRFPA